MKRSGPGSWSPLSVGLAQLPSSSRIYRHSIQDNSHLFSAAAKPLNAQIRRKFNSLCNSLCLLVLQHPSTLARLMPVLITIPQPRCRARPCMPVLQIAAIISHR